MRTFLIRHRRAFVLIPVGLLLVGYLGISLLIGRQVENVVARAQSLHDGGPVDVLMAVVRSDEASLDERNHAIWALGQLGEPEALSVLRSLVTGEGCDHATAVCQRELVKAIDGCSGSFNAGALIWRHGELASR